MLSSRAVKILAKALKIMIIYIKGYERERDPTISGSRESASKGCEGGQSDRDEFARELPP